MQDQDGLSRRDFAAISVAAGLSAAAGSAQAAVAVSERAAPIKTAEGVCDAVLLAPTGKKSPGVILYPDAAGLRPAMVEMAKRLAGEGYAVLAVNQFYRDRKVPIFPPSFSFSNPDDRAAVGKLMAGLSPEAVTRDAAAFVEFLDAQPEVRAKAKIGAVGYCMGGAMTIRAAAVKPDRVGAGVSFHGGGLVNDRPDSPHLLVANTKAAYHIGVAADDDAKDPQAKVTLKAALDAAKRPVTMEVYPASKHGWTVTDSAAYDREQAERAWAAMIETFRTALV